MSLALAVGVVLGFAGVLHLLELPARATEVGRRSREALETLRDRDLDDDAKARALRRHSLRLFVLMGILLGGSVLSLGLPLGGVWLLDRAGIASLPAVWSVLESPGFLAATVVGGTGLWLVGRRAGRR